MSPAKKKSPDFEQQLAELEELVADLESGELSLEQGVSRYGEGVQLLKQLFSSLSSAEKQVEELSLVLRKNLEELDGEDSDDLGDE